MSVCSNKWPVPWCGYSCQKSAATVRLHLSLTVYSIAETALCFPELLSGVSSCLKLEPFVLLWAHSYVGGVSMTAWSHPACSVEGIQLEMGLVCSLSTFEIFIETKLYSRPQWGAFPDLLPASSPGLGNSGCHCCSAELCCLKYQGTELWDSYSFHCVSVNIFKKLLRWFLSL